MIFSEEQIKDLLERGEDVKVIESFLNRIKTKLSSNDVKGLYNEEYEEILSNHPMAFMVDGKYKINIYLQYIYQYITEILKPGDRILDFGCNSGELILAIASQMDEGKFVGVDFSKIAIENAVQNLNTSGIRNCEFFCCDINDFVSEEKFDYILMSDVIEHLSDSELSAIIRKCKTLLKDDGKIIMHTPNGLNEYCQSDRTLYSRLFFWIFHKSTNSKFEKSAKQIYYEQVHINVKSYRQWKYLFRKCGYNLTVKYDDNGAKNFFSWESLQQLLSLNGNMMLVATKSKG